MFPRGGYHRRVHAPLVRRQSLAGSRRVFSIPLMESSKQGSSGVRYESGGRYKHASRTAGGVENAPMVGLDHFSQESDNAAGCVELSSTLASLLANAPEIFVDAPKRIVVQRSGDLRSFLSILQQRAAE